MKKMWVMMGLCLVLSCAAKTQKETQGVSDNIPGSCSSKTDCIEDDTEPGLFSLPYRPGIVPDDDQKIYDVVEQMPHWIPGREHDYVLRVNYTIPVTFRLDKQPVNKGKILWCDLDEQMPSFPGGGKALLKYLEENVQYPKELDETCVQGRVIVTCIVEKDGSITGAKVIKGLCPALDAEALRVVSAMPRWIPGKRMGEPISVKYVIPVNFRLK
ncbi:MAG: energy transducer TonB [Prevotella sp.]|nr:energy transducer TonB [Prevotella sp.]